MTSPVLDLAHLVRQTFGDADLEREILGLFEEQCERLLPVMVSGRGCERAEAAHTLKGAAKAVGASQLATLAGELEQAEGGISARLVAQLRAAVAEVQAAIAARRIGQT